MSAALALQRAVFAALAADPALTALLGGAKVYDGAPRNASPPYLHLDEMEARDHSTATEAEAEIRFAIAVHSRQPGRSEALAIAQRVHDVLHDADLPLAGYRLANLRLAALQTARTGKPEARRTLLRFRAVVETP